MRLNPDQLLAELLQLPSHVRARLAEGLIASLDDDIEVEQEWRCEVERRIAELDAGTTQTRPAEEVFRSVRSGLRGA